MAAVCRDLHENHVLICHVVLVFTFIWIGGKNGANMDPGTFFTDKRYLWICVVSSQTAQALPVVSHPNLS